MRVLVAYECSGRVREAFRAIGHDAWSNDILPAEDGSEFHLQMDAWLAIIDNGPWDMILSFRPCTYLCGSGIHWNDRGRGWGNTNRDLEDVRKFMDYCENMGIPYALENPVDLIGSKIRKPDQTIQPYFFGDDASKRTCLWLYKLHALPIPPKDKWFPPRIAGGKERWGNQTDSGQNRLGPSESRAGDRSRTYPGIAKAMAEAWG